MKNIFCVCKCFYSKNLFIKKLKIHVNYTSRQCFMDQYAQILETLDFEEVNSIIKTLEDEVNRRKNLHIDSWTRRQIVQQTYIPLYPDLFKLNPEYLDCSLLKLVDLAREDKLKDMHSSGLLESYGHRIFSFPVFTADFCSKLIEELKNFESSDVPKGRPNTMNNYGISLDELGYDDMITELGLKYIQPISKHLFPDWGGDELDSHKAFVVTYRQGEDIDLDYHYDNAEVTLNVALNHTYSEGDLYFGPMNFESSSVKSGYSHRFCHGLLHRGQQMHGALPIIQGERYNIIIWFRSSKIRNVICPMCNEKPNLAPVSNGSGDGFTIQSEEICVLS